MMDPIDDIKAGFVILLEKIPDLAPGFGQVGKVFPERTDDYYKSFPAVSIEINGEDMRRTTRLPMSNEIVLDDSDPENIKMGYEALNAEYPVKVMICAVTPEQKRSLAAKVLAQVLRTSMNSEDPAVATGFYKLPSGNPCRIKFHSSDDWEEEDQKGEQKKWKKLWMRELTFTVNATFIVEDPQQIFIVETVEANLFVNHDGLSDNNGETITII